MAGYLFNRERLRPFLLDRLIDDAATLRPSAAAGTPARLTRYHQSVSHPQYRQQVLRDLDWLLNSQAMAAIERVDDFPEVASSVINFGIPDLSSRMLSGISDLELEQMITRALERFEPRIIPHTLRVRVVGSNVEGRPGAIEVEIMADIWALPLPESIHLCTHIDPGLGVCALKDR